MNRCGFSPPRPRETPGLVAVVSTARVLEGKRARWSEFSDYGHFEAVGRLLPTLDSIELRT